MSDPIFAQLRTRIDAMESKAVREAATVILNIAATNANSVLAAHLEDALNASARVEGKIATFSPCMFGLRLASIARQMLLVSALV